MRAAAASANEATIARSRLGFVMLSAREGKSGLSVGH
jgi:hypothetical protein